MILTKGNRKRIIGELAPEHRKILEQIVTNYPDELLHMPSFRTFLAGMNLKMKAGDIQTMETDDDAGSNVIGNTVSHNLRTLQSIQGLFRPTSLIMPLRTIEWVVARLKTAKVLSVGPRSEAEIYTLVSCGFDPANIRGLDLISYSDYVDIGDMHAMPYEDNSFDIVVLGWVLAYSRKPEDAAAEVLRVLKPGGIVAVGCEYTPPDKRAEVQAASDVPEGGIYETCDDILAKFGDAVDHVYLRHDIHPDMVDQAGAVMTIFSTRKE